MNHHSDLCLSNSSCMTSPWYLSVWYNGYYIYSAIVLALACGLYCIDVHVIKLYLVVSVSVFYAIIPPTWHLKKQVLWSLTWRINTCVICICVSIETRWGAGVGPAWGCVPHCRGNSRRSSPVPRYLSTTVTSLLPALSIPRTLLHPQTGRTE